MTSKKAKIVVEDGDWSEMLSASAETVMSNEDLATEILLHVPAKSVITLKCVCKDWNRIISSSRFVYNQYARNTELVSGMYFHANRWDVDALECLSLQGHISLFNLSFLGEFHHRSAIRLEHSCCGLMLFRNWLNYFCVCNLTTEKCVVLPRSPHSILDAHCACLAFDPLTSPYYKVVVISEQIWIYFSENKSWRHIQISDVFYPSIVAFWDGAIHWMNENNIHYQFVVDQERLITTQMPPKPKILKPHNIRFFGECDGQLLLIQCRTECVKGFWILGMTKGSCCWNVRYRVNLRRVPHVKQMKARNFHVLGIVRESRKSDLMLVLATPGKLFSYNLKRKELGFVRDISLRRYQDITDFPGSPFFPFIESLFAVSFGTGI